MDMRIGEFERLHRAGQRHRILRVIGAPAVMRQRGGGEAESEGGEYEAAHRDVSGSICRIGTSRGGEGVVNVTAQLNLSGDWASTVDREQRRYFVFLFVIRFAIASEARFVRRTYSRISSLF